MRFSVMSLLMALTISVIAAPLDDGPASVEIPNITTLGDDLSFNTALSHNMDITNGEVSATRIRCGEYKFDDGVVQTFYSQVWVGLPRDQTVCRPFKYDIFHNKAGQEGNMVGAKIDPGCTCFFYTFPCDPSHYAEAWVGWEGNNNYAFTDKGFKAWWCHEYY